MVIPKPRRGTALAERRARKASAKAEEQRIMRLARTRDQGRCRVPGCPYRTMPVDVCHERHRGMGGNPKGDRTTLDALICLCRVHHGMYDAGDLRIKPLTASGLSGLCQFWVPYKCL